MFRQRLLAAAVGVIGLLLSLAVGSAQHRGGGSGRGGTSHAGGAHVGGAHVGGSGHYHSGYGSGYRPYYYGSPLYVAPLYAPRTVYVTPAPSYYYSPPVAYVRPAPPAPAESANVASLDVRVPPDAQIWFDGERTSQTGGSRSFVSPPLEPGRSFTYEIRARWIDNGTVVDLTKQVQIRASDRIPVDFLAR